jgi:hypothetical protein
VLAPAPASVALVGQPASLAVLRTLYALPGAFVLTGQPTTNQRAITLQALTGAFDLLGRPASPARAYELDAAAGAFRLGDYAISMSVARKLQVGGGAFAVTGVGAAFSRKRVLLAGPGVFHLDGASPVGYGAVGRAQADFALVARTEVTFMDPKTSVDLEPMADVVLTLAVPSVSVGFVAQARTFVELHDAALTVMFSEA